MLTIKTFTVNPLGENCYVVSSDNGEAAIIDCGAREKYEFDAIAQHIDKESLQVKYLLQTHGHFDHVLGLGFASERYRLLPMMHPADTEWYTHTNEICFQVFGEGLSTDLPALGTMINHGDVLMLGSDTLQVIHTPGHTQGGVCFYCESQGIVFTGDTLFCNSIGRADLEGGNQPQLIRMIRERLLTLPDDVVAYPGHGGSTTIGDEKMYNYYLSMGR